MTDPGEAPMSDIRTNFHAELDGIKADVVRLAAMVT